MFIDVDGLRVNVERSGAGPSLLLLHGWAGSIRSFAALIPSLNRRFSVTAFDFPGFGLSAIPPSAWSVADYVSFVMHLMRRLEMGPTFLIGHSHGGRVAIALAAQAADAVQRLILVDSAGIRPPRTLPLRGRGLIARMARRVLARPRAGAWGQRALAALYGQLGMSDYANAGPMRATLVRIVNEDLQGLLPLIGVPTLVVWGDQDRETPLWMGEQMARVIPDARLIVLRGAGHYSYLDQPQRFAQAVLDFLGAEASA